MGHRRWIEVRFVPVDDAEPEDLRTAGEYVPIPDYAFDCHTKRGRMMGQTKADFFKAEQDALQPRLPGLFDDLTEED